MSFKVFLSYSLDPNEEALAWRLQTLATSHGIEMYVPRRGRLPGQPAAQVHETENAINRSDCVLAIITDRANAAVAKELKFALGRQKLVIPIVSSDLAGSALLAPFPKLFTFSPQGDPGKLESEVVNYLKQQQVSKDKVQAIGALVAVGVGLLVLFSLSEK